MNRKLVEVYDYLNQKLLVTSLTILFAYIIFHRPIEDAISNSVVKYVLSKVDSNWPNNLIIIITAAAVLFVGVVKFRTYIPSTRFFCFYLVGTLIYIYYRFFSTRWILTPISFWTS